LASGLDRTWHSHRLRAPADPDETRRIERWLATARVFLAVCALVAILIEPSQLLGYSWPAYGLLGFYMGNSILVLMLLRRRKRSTASFRLLVHTADILWPVAISVFAEGPRRPFSLFFVFVLAAAAYRWGFLETVATAITEVGLLWIASLTLLHAVPAAHGVSNLRLLAGIPINVTEFEPNRLFILSAYLMVMALLLGYLGEQQKYLRAERAFVNSLLSKVRVEAGLTGTLEQILRQMVDMYGASRALIASQEVRSHRLFLGELTAAGAAPLELRWLDAKPEAAQTYLHDSSGNVCYTSRQGKGWRSIVLDEDGNITPSASAEEIDELRKVQPFDSLLTVTFWFGIEWRGRIFLFDPRWHGEKVEELRFLLDLVHQVGPAVYNVYLLHRLRRRAGAAERAKFARELHDGAIQSLIAVEMQVDVLKRQAVGDGKIAGELTRIQALLREEVLKLRELMQQMKAIDVDAERLLSVLHDTVERFQRETGITARFITDIEEPDMPQKVCREIVRIVQEGLVNIRKHSGARHVLVRLGSGENDWSLCMEDDGKGFPFSGRMTLDQLEEIGKGPMIIKERVRLIAGELTVESNPGKGTRLQVTVPRSGEVQHAF
jgi:signal transduction histidine kinase